MQTGRDPDGEENIMTHAVRPLAATKAAILFVFVVSALVTILAPTADACIETGLSGGVGNVHGVATAPNETRPD